MKFHHLICKVGLVLGFVGLFVPMLQGQNYPDPYEPSEFLIGIYQFADPYDDPNPSLSTNYDRSYKYLRIYAEDGFNLILAGGTYGRNGAYDQFGNHIKGTDFLDAAQDLGLKVLVGAKGIGVARGDGFREQIYDDHPNDSRYACYSQIDPPLVTTANDYFKTHPAVIGYMVSDELYYHYWEVHNINDVTDDTELVGEFNVIIENDPGSASLMRFSNHLSMGASHFRWLGEGLYDCSDDLISAGDDCSDAAAGCSTKSANGLCYSCGATGPPRLYHDILGSNHSGFHPVSTPFNPFTHAGLKLTGSEYTNYLEKFQEEGRVNMLSFDEYPVDALDFYGYYKISQSLNVSTTPTEGYRPQLFDTYWNMANQATLTGTPQYAILNPFVYELYDFHPTIISGRQYAVRDPNTSAITGYYKTRPLSVTSFPARLRYQFNQALVFGVKGFMYFAAEPVFTSGEQFWLGGATTYPIWSDYGGRTNTSSAMTAAGRADLVDFHMKLRRKQDVLLNLEFAAAFHQTTESGLIPGEHNSLDAASMLTSANLANDLTASLYFQMANCTNGTPWNIGDDQQTLFLPMTTNDPCIEHVMLTTLRSTSGRHYFWVFNKDISSDVDFKFQLKFDMDLIDVFENQVCSSTNSEFPIHLEAGGAKLFEIADPPAAMLCVCNSAVNSYLAYYPHIEFGEVSLTQPPLCAQSSCSHTLPGSYKHRFNAEEIVLGRDFTVAQGADVAFRALSPTPNCGVFKTDPGEPEALLAERFDAHPNPTTGRVVVDYQGEDAVLSVTDLHGKVIFENRPLKSGSMEIDLSGISKGIYIISVETPNERLFKKVILM